MLKLAKDYDKSLEEEEKMTAEQLEIKNVGKVLKCSDALDNLIPILILLSWPLVPLLVSCSLDPLLILSCSLAPLLSRSLAHPVSSDRPQAAPGGEGGRADDEQRGAVSRSHAGHHRLQVAPRHPRPSTHV